MELYAGPADHFIRDAFLNAIADKLTRAFQEHYRYRPAGSEVRSWRNSLRAMSTVLEHGDLQETSVLLEYQLPLSSRRLDCMVLGQDAEGAANGVIVELKQWDEARPSDVEDCVRTYLGGAEREVLHPSAQVGQYARYLSDMHSAFHDNASIGLHACAYLHNQNRDAGDALMDPRYAGVITRAPLYFGDDTDELVGFVRGRTQLGDDGTILARVREGSTRPSKGLMQHVASVIEGNRVYTLIDEQLVVFNSIVAMVTRGVHAARKNVVIVKGGPGTGKSVIAANLVARLSKDGYHAQHATGSKAFTENLRREVGRRARAVFNYFNSYTGAGKGGIDVLVCDEAHRIRTTSNNRFTKKVLRSNRPQVQELIDASQVSVFLIDDLQVVRPGEVGSSALIRDAAGELGAAVHEHDLEVQFRCKGSEAFINWIDNTLQIRRTADVIWNLGNEFQFRIVPSVEDLEGLIRQHVANGDSARIVAGFCWPWAKELGPDGKLVPDVKIGKWSRPWNARPELTRLPPTIPRSTAWATDSRGIDQVGCVYTAQGFEFDHVGVIIGNDLVWDPGAGTWVGRPDRSEDTVVKRDKAHFTDLVKQTYRVLLTRGMKSCYVTFLNPATEAFFRSRTEGTPGVGPVDLGVEEQRRSAVADPRIPYVALTPGGARVFPVVTGALADGASGLGGNDFDNLRAIANEVAHALTRPDLAGWRQDAAAERELRASLRRIVRGLTIDDGGQLIEELVRVSKSAIE